MRIKLVKSVAGAGFVFQQGQEVDCSAGLAMSLVSAGHAIPCEETETAMRRPAERAVAKASRRKRNGISNSGRD